jgi:hypothetical protein
MGYAGWIDRETANILHHKCVESQAAYMEILSSPQQLREIDQSLPQQKDGLVKAFRDIQEILAQSMERQKALAIAVA